LQSPGRFVDRRGIQELFLVCAGLLVYYLIRGFVVDELPVAQAHALDIVHLERSLHLFWEPALQRDLNGGLLEIQIWNGVYFWAHAPIIAIVGVWLYLRSRHTYALIRNAFLVSALLGLFIYYAYPVAPPRLLPSFGFVDTMQRYSRLSYQAQSLKPFVNPYAAVPSLHFGWSVLIGVGVIRALQRPFGWALGSVLPLLMLIAVIATANHFVFDAVMGLIVCGAGLGLALAFQRWQSGRQRAAAVIKTRDVREPAVA
jgi:PAP2 superfamily